MRKYLLNFLFQSPFLLSLVLIAAILAIKYITKAPALSLYILFLTFGFVVRDAFLCDGSIISKNREKLKKCKNKNKELKQTKNSEIYRIKTNLKEEKETIISNENKFLEGICDKISVLQNKVTALKNKYEKEIKINKSKNDGIKHDLDKHITKLKKREVLLSEKREELKQANDEINLLKEQINWMEKGNQNNGDDPSKNITNRKDFSRIKFGVVGGTGKIPTKEIKKSIKKFNGIFNGHHDGCDDHDGILKSIAYSDVIIILTDHISHSITNKLGTTIESRNNEFKDFSLEQATNKDTEEHKEYYDNLRELKIKPYNLSGSISSLEMFLANKLDPDKERKKIKKRRRFI